MAELRKCSRCTSTMEIKYFAINRKGDHYKCCDRCRGYTQKYVSNNEEKVKKSNDKLKEKRLNTEVDENHKCCTKCYKIQEITQYGEYKSWDIMDGEVQEIMIPYKTCKTCRDKDDIYRWQHKHGF